MQSPDILKFLVGAGNCAPSADNMQPWHLMTKGDQLVLRYDARRFADAVFPYDHQATLLTIGAVIENLSLACRSIGLDAQLVPIVPKAAPYEYLRIRIPHEIVQRLPASMPWQDRHTNRLPFRRETVTAAVTALPEFQAQDHANVRLLDSRAAIGRISTLVRRASTVRFRTREIHDWFSASLRFSPEHVARGDGLDVGTFDLPPCGKAMLKTITSSWGAMSLFNRIGGFQVMAGVEAGSLKNSGAILAIIGPLTATGALDAGRMMQSLWIAMNQAGIAVQPYYVVSDQLTRLAAGKVPAAMRDDIGQVQTEVKSVLGLAEGDGLHMLLRIGWPKRTAVRALRLDPARFETT